MKKIESAKERIKIVTESQPRLLLGPYVLVLATQPQRGAPAVWALPGGTRVDTAACLQIARREGWRRPAQIDVIIRRRMPDLADTRATHGD